MATWFLTLKRKLKEGEKIAPQAVKIVDALAGIGVGKKTERGEVAKAAVKAGLTTKQNPERVVAYYQAELESAGIIAVEKVVAEKPAKEAKGAKPAAA